MRLQTDRFCLAFPLFLVLTAFIFVAPQANAQQRLSGYPGNDAFQESRLPIAQAAAKLSSRGFAPSWADDSKSFTYNFDGHTYRYTIRRGVTEDLGVIDRQNMRRRGGPARGRQFENAMSPDSSLNAFYRDSNLWLANADGSNERALTTDGSVEKRIKNGSASWVYGEELGQSTAMWWSPDGSKLAYYRFDESQVPDYFLQMDQTELYSTIDIEAYPKAGEPNPVVDIYVYDIASGNTSHIDIRDGAPLTDDAVGHYAYNVQWTPDGTELLVNRTNRRQNIMELAACNPSIGSCRVVVREEWPASWVDNRPLMRWLDDGERFIWESERTGWLNYYLYNVDGTLEATLTNHDFEVAGIELVDEKENELWYMARSGDNYMKLQLHKVHLNGKDNERLTDPSLHHSVAVSPDGEWFVDIAETHNTPPVIRLINEDGKLKDTVRTTDMSELEALGKEPVELFTYTSADGVTQLHGLLAKPANYDPSKAYPLILGVYNGPKTNGANESFSVGRNMTEFGFMVATLDARSANGRGKVFLDAIYENLGVVEIDDLAEGIKELAKRPYVDGGNVGIYGTSYGGYVSAMAILRYPDVFKAAVAGSAVTDWRHYDTIYTERYMYTPQVNTAGYDAGAAMPYADQLEGDLMIYYGTADNNVHPTNSMQLIQSLQQANKSFEVQVGPDRGHTALGFDRMMEFFIESLVLDR